MRTTPTRSSLIPRRRDVRRAPGSNGILVGKKWIRECWRGALKLIPTLRLTVERYFVGVGAIVIQYRNKQDLVVDDVLLFKNGVVVRVSGQTAQGTTARLA